MNWRNAGVLFVVLIVPILLILLFKTGTTKITRLPVFGPKEFVDGDSVDHRVPLDLLIGDDAQLTGKHILLYFSEGMDDILIGEATDNLQRVAKRFKEVDDVVILSIGDSLSDTDHPDTWLQRKARIDAKQFVRKHLLLDFEESDAPIADHLAFLLDKDLRIRGYYFAAHDKFDRDLLGELVVLRTEYGFKGQSETIQ